MRKVLLALSLVALPLFGQDRTNRVSLFISNPVFGWSEPGGSDWRAGIGIAFEHRFTPRWSAEVSAAREEHTEHLHIIHPGGTTAIREHELVSYPIDVTARHHFFTPHTRWRPYAGAGVRWVNAPESFVAPLDDRISAQLVGGVDFNLTPQWSLRVDVKQLLRGDAPHDESFKVSMGAGYRF